MSRASAEVAARATAAEQAGDWSRARKLYALLFDRARKHRSVQDMANALRGAARTCMHERSYEEAEELAELSRHIAEQNGLAWEVARAINVLAMIQHSQGDVQAAGDLYERALEYALAVGDDQTIGYACQNLGVVANVLGNLREARIRYLESIGSAVRSGSKTNALMAYNNLGMVCADLQEWMEAEIYFSRGIEIAQRISNTTILAKLFVNRAEPLIHIGDTARASEALDKAEVIAEHTADLHVLSDASRFRGVIARMAGNYPSAEECFAKAAGIARKAELKLACAETLEEMAFLRKLQGRPDEGLSLLREAYELFLDIGAERDADRTAELLRGWEVGDASGDRRAGSQAWSCSAVA